MKLKLAAVIEPKDPRWKAIVAGLKKAGHLRRAAGVPNALPIRPEGSRNDRIPPEHDAHWPRGNVSNGSDFRVRERKDCAARALLAEIGNQISFAKGE